MGHITCSILFLLQRTQYGHLQFLNPVFGEIHIKENPHFYEFFDASIGTTSALYSDKSMALFWNKFCVNVWTPIIPRDSNLTVPQSFIIFIIILWDMYLEFYWIMALLFINNVSVTVWIIRIPNSEHISVKCNNGASKRMIIWH